LIPIKVFVLGGDACADDATYLDAASAKEVFVKGIQLTNLKLCPGTGVSELAPLEHAIDALCSKPGADKAYSFCPEQKSKEKSPAVAQPVEDPFAELEKKATKRRKVQPARIRLPVWNKANHPAVVRLRMTSLAHLRKRKPNASPSLNASASTIWSMLHVGRIWHNRKAVPRIVVVRSQRGIPVSGKWRSSPAAPPNRERVA
jgi:hypothetical protein